MHLQTNESGQQDPLPWTPSTGTTLDLPWATTFSNIHSHPTMRKVQGVAKLLPRMKEQASTATTTTHPLFMTPFTPEELKNDIKKLLPDKSPGPSGITNRMLQAGDTDFQGIILIFFNGRWEFHTQPSDW